MKTILNYIKHFVHKLMVWYLCDRAGGACHAYEYGPEGRYVVLMSDDMYHKYQYLQVSGIVVKCPRCRTFLTSLLLCPDCGIRFELQPILGEQSISPQEMMLMHKNARRPDAYS